MRNISKVLLILYIVFCSQIINAKIISVLDFGITEAKTDIERFNILYRAHMKAVEDNCGITYSGIKNLILEIPLNAVSIPLPKYTDFSNVEITVRNNSKDFILFFSEGVCHEINVRKKDIDKGRFRSYKQLNRGSNLLIIEDTEPWVRQRRGHDYGAIRKDILLLNNGRAINKTVKPYNNKLSKPRCYYCKIGNDYLIVKNLTIRREEDSKKRTFCFSFSNHNNIVLSKITVITPFSLLTGDRAIIVNNSTNVIFEDVIIKGTYSKPDKFGYGIAMNNTWNVYFNRLDAYGDWGIFGTSNTNYCRIYNSTINRFDIHCYGKDIYCSNTTFIDLYNQFSSFYGTLLFDNCEFNQFVPVLLEASYYAYTFFEVIMKNCVVKVDPERPYLIRAGIPEPPEHIREELKSVSLPNVCLEDTEIILPNGVNTWSIFNVGAIPMPDIDGINKVQLSNVRLNGSTVNNSVELSNRPINTINNIKKIVKEFDINLIEK